MKRRKLNVGAILGGVMLLQVLQFPAEAAGTDDTAKKEFSLDEYVVTANRMPVKKSETAASVTVITSDDIAREGYTRVLEILERANVGIHDAGSAGSTVSSVFINGDDRVLVMVDGRRVTKDYLVGHGKAGINLNELPSVKNIERIEIISGPASSLYGSDAAGGVINIITRKTTKANTTVSSEAGSWGLRRYNFTTENKVDGFGYRITAEHKQQDDFEYKDYKTGDVKRMPNSAVDQQMLSVRLDKELSGERSLTLAVDHVDSRIGYGMSAPGYPWYFPTSYQDYRDTSVDLTYRWKNRTGNDSSFKIYHDSSDYDIHRYMEGYEAAGLFEDKHTVNSRTVGGEWQETWKIAHNYTLVGGVDWRKTTIDLPNSSIYGSELTNKALFLENRWHLPAAWTLTAGIRHDDYNIFGGENTIRLTVNKEINRDTNVFASWGQVFKVPTIDQLYNIGMPMGNPNLQPETGDVITLGMNTRMHDGTNLQASVFGSHLDDAIGKYFEGGVSKFKNISKQKRQGLDINLARQLSDCWNISAGYAYVKIENQEQGDADYAIDPENTQPNGYRLRAQYSRNRWDAGITLRGASGRSLKSFTASSYLVGDLMADYHINPDCRAYFKVYNFTNEAYEMKGVSGYPGAFPMAARHVYLGVEQRF